VAEATNSELGMSELDDLFAGARAARFPIVGQVIEPGRAFFAGVNSIEVKAVYNQNEIAFMVSWHDMTAETTGSNSPTMSVPIFSTAVDSTGRDSTAYSDAVALLWPTEMPAGVERPYFMFGDADNAMDIWFADLASNNAQVFLGKGSESITPQDGNVRVSSTYEDGKWSVIFKRDRLPEEGLRFEEDTFVPVTFSVWDGFNQERGNKRGVSSWYHVYLTPMEKESPVGPMLSSGLITLLLSLGVVMLVRMRHKNQSDA
jgi:hypothetical protein